MPAVQPTLISNFEILFTPQLPPGLGPTVVQKVDEYVVKGYFLTISNPNPLSYVFNIGFHCNTLPNPPVANRTLLQAVGFLDNDSTGIPLTISAGASTTDFSVTVTVAANGTLLIGILPAFFTATGLANPNIECRGWVDITLPALLRRPPVPLVFVPQSANPVSVILTAEQRLTFLPIPGDVATAVEAQSAFALPLASGAAVNSVTPQPGGPLIVNRPQLQELQKPEKLFKLEKLIPATPEDAGDLFGVLLSGSPAVQSGKSLDSVLDELGFK